MSINITKIISENSSNNKILKFDIFAGELSKNIENNNYTKKSPLHPSLKQQAEVKSSTPSSSEQTIYLLKSVKNLSLKKLNQASMDLQKSADTNINESVKNISNFTADTSYRNEILSNASSEFIFGFKNRTTELIKNPSKIISDPANLFVNIVNDTAKGMYEGAKTVYSDYKAAKKDEHVYALADFGAKNIVDSVTETVALAAAVSPIVRVRYNINKTLKNSSQNVNTVSSIIKSNKKELEDTSVSLAQLAKTDISKKIIVSTLFEMKSKKTLKLSAQHDNLINKLDQLEKDIDDVKNLVANKSIFFEKQKTLIKQLEDKSNYLSGAASDLYTSGANIASITKTATKRIKELSHDRFSEEIFFKLRASKKKSEVFEYIEIIDSSLNILEKSIKNISKIEKELSLDIKEARIVKKTVPYKTSSGEIKININTKIQTTQKNLLKISDKLSAAKFAMENVNERIIANALDDMNNKLLLTVEKMNNFKSDITPKQRRAFKDLNIKLSLVTSQIDKTSGQANTYIVMRMANPNAQKSIKFSDKDFDLDLELALLERNIQKADNILNNIDKRIKNLL